LTYQVEVGGHRREVSVRRLERRFEVAVDGRRFMADLVRAGSAWSLLVAPADAGPGDGENPDGGAISGPAASYEVAIEEKAGGTTVYINGHPIPVMMDGGPARFGRRGASGDRESSGPRRIVASMPGRVVKVLVRPGDVVEARQGLVVVEAMKMENEMRAPGQGTVTEVLVAEGASVEANTVLVVIS
jgi:biotin carboxyl carrier protein